MVTDTKNGIGKNGKPYGSITLQDYSDSFRFMMFDKDYIENSKFFIIGYYLLVKGRVQKRKYKEEELEFRIKTINLLSSVKDELIKSATIRVKAEDLSNELISELMQFVKENPGEAELKFLIIDLNEKLTVQMFSRIIKIRLNNNLISYLEDHPSLD